ncbi:carbohydrate-binding protein [Haliscomenobacter sp.]|uniref:carbohydrate-binding protein n=1 Tax=Haliscomenobacter sp. TaxID=2717303 RepID=UPI003593244F
MQRITIIGILIMGLLQGLTAQLPVWATLNGETRRELDVLSLGQNQLAVISQDPNYMMKWKHWNGSSWSAWKNMFWSLAPTLCPPKVVSWGPNRMDAFVVASEDRKMYHAHWNGGEWSDWENLGGNFSGDFDVVSWGAGRLDLFARDYVGGLQHLWYDQKWGQWTTIHSGKLREKQSVTAVCWGPNRIDVFTVKTDATIQHFWYDQKWQSAEFLPGTVAGDLTAVSFAPNHLDIFGEGHDGAVWHQYWDGNRWSDWHSLGGKLANRAEIEAVAWGGNRLDLFVKGADAGLYHAYWAGGNTWSGFENLGGKMLNGPAVCSYGPNRLDIFAAGTDQAIWHLPWNGQQWGYR